MASARSSLEHPVAPFIPIRVATSGTISFSRESGIRITGPTRLACVIDPHARGYELASRRILVAVPLGAEAPLKKASALSANSWLKAPNQTVSGVWQDPERDLAAQPSLFATSMNPFG